VAVSVKVIVSFGLLGGFGGLGFLFCGMAMAVGISSRNRNTIIIASFRISDIVCIKS